MEQKKNTLMIAAPKKNSLYNVVGKNMIIDKKG